MSDTYDIDGVTVTPQPGGYYELAHPSLAEAEKVRGKEVADTRAKAIAAAAAPTEGSIPPQPAIETVALPEPPPSDDVAELRAMLDAQQAQIAALLARPATTVEVEGEAAVPDPLAAVPREFAGQVDAKTRKAMAKLGVEYVTIVLEEGNDIPPTGLFLGHNGRSYMISPGEPVDVPDFLLGILDHAVMSAPVVDTQTQQIRGYRNRMKYPYRRV
jgi:hypothetical protein